MEIDRLPSNYIVFRERISIFIRDVTDSCCGSARFKLKGYSLEILIMKIMRLGRKKFLRLCG